jgi:hypothetical protein
MKWKTVAKVAKVVAYAVVPGAAGYVAYKHVIRPWLDQRAAKSKEGASPATDNLAPKLHPAGSENSDDSKSLAARPSDKT